jgi:hypothetical protein
MNLNHPTVYLYVSKNSNTYFDDFFECVHDMLCDTIENSMNVLKYSRIEVQKKSSKNKKHNIINDILYMTNDYNIISEYKNKVYVLNNDLDLSDFLMLYGSSKNDLSVKTLQTFKYLIKQLNKYDNVDINCKKNIVNKNETSKKTFDINEIKNEIDNTFTTITQFTNKINTKPTIEKVYYPEEIDIIKESDEDSDDDITLNSEFDIDNDIKKLEETKKELDNTVKKSKTELQQEDENLAKFSCIVNQKNYELKREKEKDEEYKNIFTSDKEYTYPKIYNHFFIKKIIKSWDSIPPLFMIKFVIFLYMDGKNDQGEDVRPRILNTDDEFRIYKLLFNSITDDEFEMPDDDTEDAKLVCEFMETMPPVPIVTPDDIMNSLNESDDELFGQDDTSICSGEDKTDVGGNATY